MKEISIQEFEGLSIGQAENKAAATGCTVLLLGKNGACVGQDVRGGGRRPCFGSLYPPLAALTFAAQSIICAFCLAACTSRSLHRHLELCGIA